MVTLPPEFVATKYPGYFWNLKTKKLYSLKIGGVLRELTPMKSGYCGKYNKPLPKTLYENGYRVSVAGRNRYLFADYLYSLNHTDSVIPTVERGLKSKAFFNTSEYKQIELHGLSN